MKQKRILKIEMIVLLLVLVLPFVSSALRSDPQYVQFMGTSGGEFDESMCQSGQDFLVQISPFGCTPAVVRSDLLEEQNVPVFCQVDATKINPLIDVQTIGSVSFVGEYPPEIEGIAFHPARAALGIDSELTDPLLNNIGYVVIVLKQQANASDMPEYVSGNLTAKIRYDAKNALGIGRANFYLPELGEAEWERNRYQYSFWENKGALRAEDIEGTRATISIYVGDNKLTSVTLNEGEESNEITLPGFECSANLQIKLNSLENPDTRALLRINSDIVEVAEGEKFLENKCRVINLEKQGLVEKVKIRCTEDDGVNSFSLMISPKVNLSVGGIVREVELGEKLYDYQSNELFRGTIMRSVYLAYIGASGEPGGADNLFVYLVSTPEDKSRLSESELARYNNLVGNLLTGGTILHSGLVEGTSTGIEWTAGKASELFNLVARGEHVYSINYGDESEEPFGTSVIVNGFAEPRDMSLGGDTQEYYDLAVDDYDTIVESFSGEKYFEDIEEVVDEEAVYRRIVLAWNSQQKATVIELCDEFKMIYPDSEQRVNKFCNNEYELSSQESSVAYVTINGRSKEITLDRIYEPTINDYSVKIFVSNAIEEYNGEKDLRKNKEVYISDNESIILKELENDYAVFDIVNVDHRAIEERLYDPRNLKIELGEEKIIGTNGYRISLEEINLKKSAKVTLSPGFEDSGTEANFGFKIGIEQRSFQLLPDKIREKIEKLDGELNKWQNFSNKLGDVVKGLKVACIATGASLTVKNFLANTGGQGVARKYVMRGSGGWYEKCAEKVIEGIYLSREQCLIGEAENIEGNVSKLSELISEQNDGIQELEADFITKSLGQDVVNTEDFMEVYSEQVIDSLEGLGNVPDPNGVGDSINMEEMMISLEYDGWQNRNYNREQLREIELYASVLESDASPELKEIAERELYSVLLDVQVNAGNYAEMSSWAGVLGISNPGDIPFIEIGENVKGYPYRGWTSESLGNPIPGVTGNTPLGIVHDSTGRKYLFVLDESLGRRELPIKRGDVYLSADVGTETIVVYDEHDVLQIYNSVGTLLIEEDIPSEIKNIYFQVYDSSSYENRYKNAELSYYDTEPYKGLPAIVPFDLDNGWYVAIKQTLPVLGNIGAYTAAGAANSVWLCNVGENGLEENMGGDDIYQMINFGTGQPLNQFPGLNDDEAERIINDAQTAVEEASTSNSRSGRVNILGQGIDVGMPAVNLPDIECTDLMSVKDCQLLFNVCDPVICPSSRCDLGGLYPVRDVIQTGIIGSLALCLPNFQEGIFIPICLTGVQAGIDGWLSVKLSYRDCLQNALDTGEMVGICDEIYSIYMCEFFWRQVLPLADLSIPRIVGALMGQNTRGGGEYLFAENAWSAAKDSATYFTQYYGANSNKAFKARTTEEVGTEICKVSVSAVYASGVDIIDTLAEPDSPVQFHGRFDEIPFSSVTSPPTSHYKVFYHIFAGRDSGAYYQVYLKGIPESSYYQDSSSTLIIASGYAETGGYATETRDLTAVSGYQQLCINVNGQEECGFNEVSTSFAIDYVSDQYTAYQVKNVDIQTERQCIRADNLGIIRICGTDNPGKGSDGAWDSEDSRWKEVGYCGDEEILCWLDTESVEDAIDISFIAEDALENVTRNYLDILREKEGYLTKEQFEDEVKKIRDVDAVEQLILIANIFDKVFLNNEKAYLFLLRGNVYAELAIEALKEELRRREAERAAEDAREGDEDEEEEDEELKVYEKSFEYEKRYEKLAHLFEEYSQEEYLPDGWSENRFKALLVAIAIRQSKLGHPPPEEVYDPRWIMEYGWEIGDGGLQRMENYKCHEGESVDKINEEELLMCARHQIESASKLLRAALDKDLSSGSVYSECNWRSGNHLRCVLSVYYTGERSRFFRSTPGEVYADQTIDLMNSLEEYFDEREEIGFVEEDSSEENEETEPPEESASEDESANENSDDYEIPGEFFE